MQGDNFKRATILTSSTIHSTVKFKRGDFTLFLPSLWNIKIIHLFQYGGQIKNVLWNTCVLRFFFSFT